MIGFGSAIVGITTASWLLVTLLTRPTDRTTLERFYRRVRPGGPGWGPLARACADVQPDRGFARLFRDWAAGVVAVYATLFAVGHLLFGGLWTGLLLALLALGAGAVVYLDLTRRPA